MNLFTHHRWLHKLLAAVMLTGTAWAAQAQDTTFCGTEIKADVAKQLAPNNKVSEEESLKLQGELYAKYSFCADDAKNVPPSDPFYTAARQCGATVSYLGSTYYEEMPCCGYDPQKRSFACPVKIKKTFGFGAAPNPGSREYVLHCVADANGIYQPVGQDSVHLADAPAGANPTWQFAVVAGAVDNLQTVQPMNAATRSARSILSWNLKPTSCDYKPIWGNVLQYRVRLNQ
jgi:hypothetical protein